MTTIDTGAFMDADAAATVHRIVVIDDHDLLAGAVRIAFDQEPTCRVVATAGTWVEALEVVATFRPDLIVTDRRLADVDVDDHLGQLQAASPRSRILLMTGWPTERAFLSALRAGAHGVIAKSQSVVELVAAAHRVLAGELVAPAWLLPALLGDSHGGEGRNRLTARELDVLELLATGAGSDDAAAKLCISVNTLRNHLRSAMAKLGVHNRLAAVSAAVERGLVSPQLPGRAAAGYGH